MAKDICPEKMERVKERFEASFYVYIGSRTSLKYCSKEMREVERFTNMFLEHGTKRAGKILVPNLEFVHRFSALPGLVTNQIFRTTRPFQSFQITYHVILFSPACKVSEQVRVRLKSLYET